MSCTENKNVLTITEAAAALKTTIPKILMLLKNGALKGELVDGEWEIDAVSSAPVHHCRASPHPRGAAMAAAAVDNSPLNQAQ